jgi:nucleotide-binding universal stress UspA family protein
VWPDRLIVDGETVVRGIVEATPSADHVRHVILGAEIDVPPSEYGRVERATGMPSIAKFLNALDRWVAAYAARGPRGSASGHPLPSVRNVRGFSGDERRRTMTLTNILVPLDGSELAEAALATAIDILSEQPATTLILLGRPRHVRHRRLIRWRRGLAWSGRRKRISMELPPVLRECGITRVKTSVWYGPAAPTIVEAAEAERADLIIISSHGRGGIGRLIFVLWQSRCCTAPGSRYCWCVTAERHCCPFGERWKPVQQVAREQVVTPALVMSACAFVKPVENRR